MRFTNLKKTSLTTMQHTLYTGLSWNKNFADMWVPSDLIIQWNGMTFEMWSRELSKEQQSTHCGYSAQCQNFYMTAPIFVLSKLSSGWKTYIVLKKVTFCCAVGNTRQLQRKPLRIPPV